MVADGLAVTDRPASSFSFADDELLLLSRRNEPYRIERNLSGGIIRTTPVGRDGGQRELRFASTLMHWADANGRGEATVPNAGWNLPDASMISPVSFRVERQRIAGFTAEEIVRYLPLCPGFMIEVRSQSDSASVRQPKMETLLADGARWPGRSILTKER